MNEILQKVKGVSGSQSAMGLMEDGDPSIFVADADETQENNNELDSSGAMKVSSASTTVSSVDSLDESTFRPVHVNGDHSSTSPLPVFHSESTNGSDEVDVSLSSNFITVEQESTYTLTSDSSTKNDYEQDTVSFQYSDESSTGGNCDVTTNGTAEVSETGELLDTEAPMVSQIHTVWCYLNCYLSRCYLRSFFLWSSHF